LANDEAVQLVTGLFDEWHQVETASISFRQAGQLLTDVTGENYMGLLNSLAGQFNPIIFDADGSITDAVFGVGARRRLLGFAFPHQVGDRIVNAMAVLNGAFIDGKSDPPDLPLEMFRGVFIHEFGHYVGLDHSQLGMDQAFDADPTNDSSVPTMLPVLVAEEQKTLHLDDAVALSTLYPNGTFSLTGGTIRGYVLTPAGISGLGGANVIARRRDKPTETAVSTVTGYYSSGFGARASGYYEIRGLPPGRYTVEVEPINPVFRNGSSVGPISPPVSWDSPREFYSGPEESNRDDPLHWAEVEVAVGGVVDDVNIILNSDSPAPTNDLCLNARVISGLTAADILEVGMTTVSNGDPRPSCRSSRSRNVWYRFRALGNGTVTVDTYGSNFDTVTTAYTGACGALVEVGCNDNSALTGAGWITQSQLSFPVTEGKEYLIEISSADGLFSRSIMSLHYSFVSSTGGPDLTVNNLRLSPTPVGTGRAATISFTILNHGDRSSNPTELELRLAPRNYRIPVGALLANRTIDALGPGEARHYEINFVIPADVTPGTQFIGIIVDPKNKLPESIEGNNVVTGLFEVVDR
jgi:hypothetical protein